MGIAAVDTCRFGLKFILLIYENKMCRLLVSKHPMFIALEQNAPNIVVRRLPVLANNFDILTTNTMIYAIIIPIKQIIGFTMLNFTNLVKIINPKNWLMFI